LVQTPFFISARKHSVRAFTLVEVLVATSVLTLMVLMLTALMNSAALTVTAGNRHLAADDQARLVFDRMQVDFARMLRRNDVYISLNKATGNDSFTFMAETPGYFAASGSLTSSQESNVSLINYQIPAAGTTSASGQNLANQLCRIGQGYQWTGIAFTPASAPTPDVVDNAHILSNSIFRMESAFIYRAGDTALQISSIPPTAGSNMQNLEAVIVALGVLDSDSQKIVPAGSYPTLIAALHDYPDASSSQPASQTISLSTASGTVTPATIDPILSNWRSEINSPTFAATADIPAAAARQVRVYQRIIYLQ